jgi:hypothetical protein
MSLEADVVASKTNTSASELRIDTRWAATTASMQTQELPLPVVDGQLRILETPQAMLKM